MFHDRTCDNLAYSDIYTISLLCYNCLKQKGVGQNKYRNTNYRNAVTKVTARKRVESARTN